MPRGVPRENGAGRVDRASFVANTRQNIPSLVEGREVLADEPEAPVTKKATGEMSKTKANPVKVTTSAPEDLSVAEKNSFDKFVKDSNIQGRFEAMDRSVNFPLGRG
jgi:hypothetical protein